MIPRFLALRLTLAVACILLPLIHVVPTGAQAQGALQFDGSNDYVTFGQASSLGAARFTLELWFQRTGAGITTTTGTGGITAVPLLTKGRGEADGDLRDMNYFLGIRATDNVLVADYEEGSGQTQPGLNHPVVGVTPIRNNTWYHAAVTFDGTTWRLFLNGVLETELVVGANRLPQSLSTQHAGLATAMTSNGTAAGFFAGVQDEARIWGRARSQAAIADSMLLEIGSGTGLLGRWGLNEGSGTVAYNSVAGGVNGTLMNGPLWVTGCPFTLVNSLSLGPSNAYVTFGAPPTLGLPQFTLEGWFRRDGTGTAVSTGTGGVTAIPLVTKGAAEADGSNVDANYFMGIRSSDGVLCADFEEGSGGASPGLNHPVAGTTPITTGQWYHAAATYDGTTWRLYLNGVLDGELAVGQPPQDQSIQHAGVGTTLKSTGVASGFFNGTLDEVRIWSYARTVAQVDSTINDQIAGARPGLVARWGLNEGAGNRVHSTAGTTIDGTITATGWSWSGPAPFDILIVPPEPPAAPTGLTATAVSSAQIDLGWTDNASNELQFEIERSTDGAGGPFQPLVTVPANTVSWSDGSVGPLAEYCYRVRATNAGGDSGWSNVACATTPDEGDFALDFGGTNAYVGFGQAASLGVSTFTIECWFRRDGAGVTANTGSSGVLAVPLVTKGVGEADGDTRDMNYFLGIEGTTGKLCADFEEGSGGSTPGLNHPVVGATPVPTGEWCHAAVTYDGSTWSLYLNGLLETELYVGRPPQSLSIQHVALASALNSTGSPSGYLDGVLDEVRIWDYARTLAQIQTSINEEITSSQVGLIARWGLNEGAGTAVHGTAGTTVAGTVMGSAWSWTPGAPFNLEIDNPPDPPALVQPSDGAVGVPTSPTLAVNAFDSEGDTLTVRFYGRPVTQNVGPDFTITGLPDTQYYTSQLNGGTPAIFRAQTEWVAAQRVARNIVFVSHFGDITEHGQNGGDPIEWQNADYAMSALDDSILTGLPEGIPFSAALGNHDQTPAGDPAGSTEFYNQFFGISRFSEREYYGGHHGSSNDTHFSLFSSSGLDFIAITIEYGASADPTVLSWADSLLAAHSGRKGIIINHNTLNVGNPGSWSSQGQTIYDALKDRPNLFLMLCGHAAGEGRRSDTYEGRTVHTLLADYQNRTNGGDGWLRIMTFQPSQNRIRVQTYSPTLDTYEADADSSSQFTLPCDLAPMQEWQEIGVVTGILSGGTASVVWSGRAPLTEYEWYATVSDSQNTVVGPVWSFTTIDQVALTVQVVGNGSILRDPDLPVYDLGASVQLTAVPDSGWTFVEWSGGATGPDNPIVVVMDAPKSITATFEAGPSDVTEATVRDFSFRLAGRNPLSGEGFFDLALPRSSHVRMIVLDVSGREVATPIDGHFARGRHRISWDGRVPAGVYFVRLITPAQIVTRRVVLIR